MITALERERIPRIPTTGRLIDLNSRRNTSVHGEWVEVLDVDALEDAIAAGRQLHAAVLAYCARKGVSF